MTNKTLKAMEKACKEMLRRHGEPLGMKKADALRHFRAECTPERVLELIALASRLNK